MRKCVICTRVLYLLTTTRIRSPVYLLNLLVLRYSRRHCWSLGNGDKEDSRFSNFLAVQTLRYSYVSASCNSESGFWKWELGSWEEGNLVICLTACKFVITDQLFPEPVMKKAIKGRGYVICDKNSYIIMTRSVGVGTVGSALTRRAVSAQFSSLFSWQKWQ